MKQFIAFLALLMLSGISLATENITVFSGEVKVMDMGAIDRVAVGNGDLLSTSMLDNGQLLLLAEKDGETTMHVWFSNGQEKRYKVIILPKDGNRQVYELRTLLADIGDINVRTVGEQIYLTGSLLSSDEELLKTIIGKYKNLIDLTRKVEPKIEFSQDKNKMIYMDVRITEFNTDKLQQLGINWSDSVAGPTAGIVVDGPTNSVFRAQPDETLTPSLSGNLPLATNGTLGFFGLASEINSRINLLASTGDAVILAEPKLSARSGGKAEFLAGGEIPVVTTGTLGSSNVEYKEFGIKLNIEPLVDDFDNILANISTEVSAVDRSNAVGDIPAFISRKTATQITMKNKETLVMSGLVDRDIGKSVEKIPYLGDIPIIGSLFRSTNFNNNKTELVIFVSPTVYDAQSQFNQDRLQHREDLLERFKKNIGREDLILD